jgi:hypothetical protein
MLPSNYFYEPIPFPLILRKSKIHGYGIFTSDAFKADRILVDQATHILCNDSFVRTPIGAFINHSDDPNCTLVKDNDIYRVKSLRKLKRGEEVTVNYNQEFCGN